MWKIVLLCFSVVSAKSLADPDKFSSAEVIDEDYALLESSEEELPSSESRIYPVLAHHQTGLRRLPAYHPHSISNYNSHGLLGSSEALVGRTGDPFTSIHSSREFFPGSHERFGLLGSGEHLGRFGAGGHYGPGGRFLSGHHHGGIGPYDHSLYRPAAILTDIRQEPLYGNYAFAFETEDGISRQESGSPIGPNGAVVQQGSWSYTLPDGTPAEFQFVADEYGFKVDSNLLPTPPPLPAHAIAQIEKAERERAAGIYHDGQYRPEDHYGSGYDSGEVFLGGRRPFLGSGRRSNLIGLGSHFGSYETGLGSAELLLGGRRPFLGSGRGSGLSILGNRFDSFEDRIFDPLSNELRDSYELGLHGSGLGHHVSGGSGRLLNPYNNFKK